MTHVATVASTRAALAYLDTCIVSGLAKGDLSLAEEAALLRILQARKAGSVELFTSEVTREEISKIPAEHRTIHFVIYGLLADVPLAKTHYRIPPFRPAPMFRRQDPLLASLEHLLPDAADALHVFQAAKAGLPYFVTVDRRTLLNHAAAVREVCNVQLVTPVEFERGL
jgi:hypothetical protein